MKVPCVDAWTILNGDKAQLSKRFDKRGNLRTGGYDAVNERVLRLYFILEHWVMGRDRPFAGRIAEPQETRAQPADAAAAAPTPDTKTPEAPEAAEAAPVANLAVNGGFEVVDAHTRFAKSWKAHQWGEEGLRYSVRIDKSDPRTGKRAVLARGFADGAKSGAYTTFTLKAGRYEVSYWASTDRDETVRVGGQLAGRDLAEKTVGGEYQQIKEIVEIPEKQIGASLRLWTVGKGRAWFDDVEVRSVP